MSQHRLVQDPKALDKYPKFKKMVADIINGDRYSQVKPESAQNFDDERNAYAAMGEDSLLNALVPLIIKAEHSNKKKLGKATFSMAVDEECDVEVTDSLSGKTYVTRWSDEGVLVGVNKNLRCDLLPNLYNDDDLAKALRKGDYMTTPRLDRIYGLRPQLFPTPDDIMLDQALYAGLQVCQGMYFPYLIIEGKGNDGDPVVAENQARRGCATLVNATRQVYESIGLVDDYNGPDYRSFVFSATLTPYLMEIWVH